MISPQVCGLRRISALRGSLQKSSLTRNIVRMLDVSAAVESAARVHHRQKGQRLTWTYVMMRKNAKCPTPLAIGLHWPHTVRHIWPGMGTKNNTPTCASG